MPRVAKREAARRDLVEHFVYLAENAGLPVADRFLMQAEATFAELARAPLIGAPLHLKHPELANLRKWRVRDFDNHLVFYEARAMGYASCACSMRLATGGDSWG